MHVGHKRLGIQSDTMLSRPGLFVWLMSKGWGGYIPPFDIKKKPVCSLGQTGPFDCIKVVTKKKVKGCDNNKLSMTRGSLLWISAVLQAIRFFLFLFFMCMFWCWLVACFVFPHDHPHQSNVVSQGLLHGESFMSGLSPLAFFVHAGCGHFGV